MKLEEITRKTQNQREKNSPSISPQRVKNITFAKKFIYHTGQCKRRWAIEYLQGTSRYKDAILYGFKT